MCVSLSAFNLRAFVPALVFVRDTGNRAGMTEKLDFLHQLTAVHPRLGLSIALLVPRG